MNPALESRLATIAMVATFLAGAALPAQASFTTFGAACLQGQAIGAANLPHLGQPFGVRYSGLIGNSFIGSSSQIASPFLIVGLSNTQAGSTPLPFTLPAAITGGATNCAVGVSPDATLALSPNAPFPFTLNLAMPSDPAFVGLALHLQWFTVVQRSIVGGPSTVHIVTSDAATAVIGP
ncbi:MAG: hypothetical protein H6838_13815 [Planctomycetes bacterium]|nr:hypothetical protein [Planctomycetota bacterium]MCB9886566.1 hypothetical protein [Planctomycetota bacterium]